MPTRNPRGSLIKRRERTPSTSATDSDSDSDVNTYRLPLQPHGSWLADFQVTQTMWLGLSLLSLFLTWAYVIPYIDGRLRHGKQMRSAYNAKIITPSSVSAIPLLYKNITYNATRKEGDIFRGRLDTFLGNTLLTFNRFINEMLDYPQGRQFLKLFEDVQADADKLYHEYMIYYDLVRRHVEDAMILTNAVVEDLTELTSDVRPIRTSNFRQWISHPYWGSISKQPVRSKLIRKLFIEYLRGLRDGYMLPQSNVYLGKSVGLRKVIEIGQSFLPELGAANDTSRALRSAVEFCIYKVLTDQNLTNPDFVPRSEILKMLPFLQRSNKKSDKGHSNDTVGYMTYWLDNKSAAGEHVREVEMSNSVHRFQRNLIDISEQVTKIIDDCLDERSGIQEVSSTICYIDAIEKGLKELAFSHNFQSIYPGHPNCPRAIWEVNKCIWKRDARGPLKGLNHCGHLERLIKEKVY
ncbi:uncharacterized protein EAF01_010987 [Botrytis porri]|uniref:Uncharacterized protein n=1 Tax=Botrytis porri TaxID=87229 RepID=A0A4Z1KDU8_9HELO|nr:uncharacterized protein EAF01_010987 [Botrytis porri]KAF7887833.1 hypothetical protein EAF01_010987 [Botrytis porri]TGO83568.1 hypothetical protein BPOR_0625g00010 [Botrytis porri]